MRDPSGSIEFKGDWVYRYLKTPLDKDHFLRSELASKLVNEGTLIGYEFVDELTLKSPKIDIITFPTEWTAEQFHKAAALTLKLHEDAIKIGWGLKDASAWNVVFLGLTPVFVDLLSFEPLRHKFWHAAGQYSRHFLLPLYLNKLHILRPNQAMQLWRDGVPPQEAKHLAGTRRFLSRYWPLMSEHKDKNNQGHAESHSYQDILGFQSKLCQGFKWMLDGVLPRKVSDRETVWGTYEDSRDHYTDTELQFKRKTLGLWLKELKPNLIIDIGCNAGEFSEIAVSYGARAICWDADSEALGLLARRYDKSNSFFPILSAIDDLSGGRGWVGEEFPGLMSRIENRADIVLFLAITHHLAIAGSIPLKEIAKLLSRLCKRGVIYELISESDPKLLGLCQKYDRNPLDFSADKQLEALQFSGFSIVDRVAHEPSSTRELFWLERTKAE